MEPTEFDNYTERLRASLESAPEVLGLIVLGSTADSTLRDEWSDHDFWVITEPGSQDSFVEDLSWLPDYEDIAITVTHVPRGRTIIFHNKHKVEFAVFDINEARSGKVERYRILIDRDQVSNVIKEIHEDTLRGAQPRPQALENLCTLLWSACERYSRGELLSARQYVDGFAVNRVLSLIADYEARDERNDILDPRRRREITTLP